MITTVKSPSTSQWRVMLTTRRNFILAMVCAGLSVVLTLAVLLPRAWGLPGEYQSWQTEKKTMQQLQGKLIALDNTLQLADQASLEITDTILPSKKPLLELLTSLRRVEAMAEVKVTNLTLSPGLLASSSSQLADETRKRRDQVGYDVLDLELSVAGSFDKVQQFMVLLEKITPFTTISSFALSENTKLEDSSAGNVSSSITTGTYFVNRPISSLDTTLPNMSQTERQVLEQLQTFHKSTLTDQTEVQGGGATDLFGVSGWEELLKNQAQ